MNLTDLTAELETRATDAVPTVAMNRLTGVRQRIRARRRKQMASAAGLTALGVAAVMLVPGWAGMRSERSDPPPAKSVPALPLDFAPVVAGDPLVATAIGTAGQTDLVLRFTPTDNNLAISYFCRASGRSADATGWTVTATVNGKSMAEGGGCAGDNGPNQITAARGEAGADNRAGWAEHGVLPGRESVFRVRVTADKAGTPLPADLRLGLGIYELSGPRLKERGVTFQELYEAGGHSYHLSDHGAAPVVDMVDGKASTPVHQIYIEVPAGRYPVQVWLGLKQTEAESKTKGSVQLYVDGKATGPVYDGGITGFQALDDAKAHSLELVVDPHLLGTMVLGYYVRVD